MSKKEKKVQVREIVYSEDDEKSFGDIFVYEPENVDEQNLGNLFILGELKDLPRNCSYIINLLASKIKKEFYSDTKRSAEESLEAGLGEANKTLSEIADQGNGEYLGKLSMVCGTYRGNSFYLSQVGKIRSLLIRSGQLLEIVREEPGRPISPKRVFTDIASGELTDGDLVLFATAGLFRAFSLEELRRLGENADVDAFSTKLQEKIEESEGDIVSALVMKIGGEEEGKLNRVDFAPREEPADLPDRDELPAEMEPEMEEVLPPAIPLAEAIEEKKQEELASSSLSALPETEPEPEREIEHEPAAEPEPVASLPSEPEPIESAQAAVEAPAASPAVQPVEAVAVPAAAEKMSLSDVIKQYEKMENKPAADESAKDRRLEEIISRDRETKSFSDLDEQKTPISRKLSSRVRSHLDRANLPGAFAGLVSGGRHLLAGKPEYRVRGKGKKLNLAPGGKLAILVLLVVVGGAFYLNAAHQRSEASKKLAANQALIVQAKAKIDQAEVDQVAGSNQEAGKLFLEARNLAQQAKDAHAGLDSQADPLIASAQAELDKLDLVVKVENPDTLASFQNDNLSNLVSLAGTYYAVDGKANAVYKVDSGKQQLGTTVTAQDQDKIGAIVAAEPLTGTQEILLSDGQGFLSYSPKTGALTKLSTQFDASFKDFTTYGRYVYLLSPDKNQIYKYQKGSTAFSGKTEWLKGGSIAQAVSLAIDQNIYVLTADGQVAKYYTGAEVTGKDGSKFALQQPSDALASPQRIYTQNGQKYLYITEPGKHRILLFDKQSGALVKQYINDQFADLRDISVDADEKSLVVLLKDKIVKINLAA